jgi:hypothetical protein
MSVEPGVSKPSDFFASLKIKACDLSQWSPDLENDVATASKAPIKIEQWGQFPKISFSQSSWIHFFGPSCSIDEGFFKALEDQGHQALTQYPIAATALIYDAKRETLMAWRGGLFTPLYWSRQNKTLILSNNLCGPIRSGWMGLSVNITTVASYLYFGQIPEDSSLVEDLYKLSPYQGLVFNIRLGTFFHFETPVQMKEEALYTPSPFACGLEALWEFQEPRADFFLSSPTLFPRFCDLDKALESSFPLVPAPYLLVRLAIYLITRLKSTSKKRKWLRAQSLRILYRPLEPLIRWFQARSIFDYQMISNKMLIGSDLVFSPWDFLQNLSSQRLYSKLSHWPKDMVCRFHQTLSHQKASEAPLFPSSTPPISDEGWQELLLKFYKSSLIEEGIIPISLLAELEYGLKTNPSLSQLQMSSLLALELWLKLFLDRQAQAPIDTEWKSYFE